MLLPAILYKTEIIENFKKFYYTEDMMFESGCLSNWTPQIVENPDDSLYQYAIINNDKKLIGFVSYRIDWYSSCVDSFGLISFDKGNILIGRALYEVMDTLINKYKLHRIEWRMVSGNPVERSYDHFCEKYNGRKIILNDVFKDREGNYHDSIIYEIINN